MKAKFYQIFMVLLALGLLGGCSQSTLSKLRKGPSSTLDPEATALILKVDAKLGEGLSPAELSRQAAAESRALEYGAPGELLEWKGDRDKIAGTVVARQIYRVGTSNCRRFEHTVVRSGVTRQSVGTACRRQGADWSLVQ